MIELRRTVPSSLLLPIPTPLLLLLPRCDVLLLLLFDRAPFQLLNAVKSYNNNTSNPRAATIKLQSKHSNSFYKYTSPAPLRTYHRLSPFHPLTHPLASSRQALRPTTTRQRRLPALGLAVLGFVHPESFLSVGGFPLERLQHGQTHPGDAPPGCGLQRIGTLV